jgi:mRNA interferase MazF
VAAYVPEAGDLVWLDFTPQSGREQAGRRPGLVLSAASYNRKAGLAMVCPITSHAKGYPFEVELPTGGAIAGTVLADHLRSVDWASRRAKRAAKATNETMRDVRERLALLLGIGGE